MVQRRRILEALTRARLADLAAQFGIAGLSGKSKDEVVQAIAGARAVKTAHLLETLSRDELKSLCRTFGLDDGGRDKQSLIARLAGNSDGASGRRRELPSEPAARMPSGRQSADKAKRFPGDGVPDNSSRRKRGSPSMAKKSSDDKRPIEQYEHADKTRVNNPPVGLVTPATDPDLAKEDLPVRPAPRPAACLGRQGRAHAASTFPRSACTSTSGSTREPSSGPCRSGTAMAGGPGRLSLVFEEPEENPPLREAIEFYKHAHGWTNRLIAGDSLVVMNSLLEKEGMAGKVQMVYIDPPYGIQYGSNFQPFVNQRDVKDGKDEDLTQEPEMIQAFRDTWELGIHSYLDESSGSPALARELLARKRFVSSFRSATRMFTSSGDLLDEVFGSENFVRVDYVRKTSGLQPRRLCQRSADFILWYAKDTSKREVPPAYSEPKSRWRGRYRVRTVMLETARWHDDDDDSHERAIQQSPSRC